MDLELVFSIHPELKNYPEIYSNNKLLNTYLEEQNKKYYYEEYNNVLKELLDKDLYLKKTNPETYDELISFREQQGITIHDLTLNEISRQHKEVEKFKKILNDEKREKEIIIYCAFLCLPIILFILVCIVYG